MNGLQFLTAFCLFLVVLVGCLGITYGHKTSKGNKNHDDNDNDGMPSGVVVDDDDDFDRRTPKKLQSSVEFEPRMPGNHNGNRGEEKYKRAVENKQIEAIWQQAKYPSYNKSAHFHNGRRVSHFPSHNNNDYDYD